MDEWLRAALAEDLGERGDVTSALALGGRGPPATGRIVAKEAGRLSGLLSATRGYAGTTIQGDGSVLLVLDVKEILP